MEPSSLRFQKCHKAIHKHCAFMSTLGTKSWMWYLEETQCPSVYYRGNDFRVKLVMIFIIVNRKDLIQLAQGLCFYIFSLDNLVLKHQPDVSGIFVGVFCLS